jgi:hypothetical protein
MSKKSSPLKPLGQMNQSLVGKSEKKKIKQFSFQDKGLIN